MTFLIDSKLPKMAMTDLSLYHPLLPGNLGIDPRRLRQLMLSAKVAQLGDSLSYVWLFINRFDPRMSISCACLGMQNAVTDSFR